VKVTLVPAAPPFVFLWAVTSATAMG